VETNLDYERVCRDVVDIIGEQSDAVYEMQLAMFTRNEARAVQEWPDEDQGFLRDLDRLEEELNRAISLLEGVERELRQENYRLRFGNGLTSRNEHSNASIAEKNVTH
jgi:hypothetical protein